MKGDDKAIRIIGIIFLIFSIGAFINVISRGLYGDVLWFCYIGLFILGVGTLRRNSLLVASQLNILLIPILFWIFDFVVLIFTGNSPLTITAYLLEGFPLVSKIISLQHLFTIPLSLYVLFKLKLKRKDAWKISIVQLAILFIVSRLLTPASRNMNCVYSPCIPFPIQNFYPIFWLVATILLVLVTNFFLFRWFKE